MCDNKMANIWLDVHTFIAHNLSKYRFSSSLDYTFLSLSVSSNLYDLLIELKANLWI